MNYSYFQAIIRLPFLLLACLLFGCLSSQSQTGVDRSILTSSTGITGRITHGKAHPAAGAYVYAYRNMRSSLRGPADFEALVDEKGHYFLDLVEGDYYLVARMRQSGADAGPPKPGDTWALPARNPVTVNPGEVTVVNFTLQGVAQPMLMREGTLTSGETGFSGQLVDSDDKPLPGAFVIAYPDNDFQHMPEATSPSVGDDGRFQLYVERPGQWCLAARTRTRGQPIAGEPYGKLGLHESGCRNAVAGKIIDVGTIRLTPYR
ncbi:hypothetical protein P9J64_08985 [Deltaproteobacteria bacterium IMCC39524]|nr:hypothetical protein [Deltaproteobacteria bacterium IMCC39524]